MLKNTGLKIVLMMLVGISLASDSLAQTTNIRFARGSSSATVSGKIGKNGERIYTVRGRKGQRITVSMRSGNNYVFAGVEAIGQGEPLPEHFLTTAVTLSNCQTAETPRIIR